MQVQEYRLVSSVIIFAALITIMALAICRKLARFELCILFLARIRRSGIFVDKLLHFHSKVRGFFFSTSSL